MTQSWLILFTRSKTKPKRDAHTHNRQERESERDTTTEKNCVNWDEILKKVKGMSARECSFSAIWILPKVSAMVEL